MCFPFPSQFYLYNFGVNVHKTVVHLINIMSISILGNKSPYEVIFEKPPNYKKLRVCRSLCYARNYDQIRNKFSLRAHRGIFLHNLMEKRLENLWFGKKKKRGFFQEMLFSMRNFPFHITQPSHDENHVEPTTFVDYNYSLIEPKGL